MPQLIYTMKLHIHPDKDDIPAIMELVEAYRKGCNFVSQYIYDNGFPMDSVKLSPILYHDIRKDFGLKSQLAQSCIKTAVARYKTIREQMKQSPYRYKDESNHWQYIPRDLEWLTKPVNFKRPQADLVRGRDYSFVNETSLLSLNTLKGRIRVSFDIPENFIQYFDGSWSFGTGKIVSLNKEWYFHIPMTKYADTEFSTDNTKHVVGIDRGLRFIATTYDEKGNSLFLSGKDVLAKRQHFADTRAQLQSKGTKSAKRVLKRISGRENRWMSDVNHQISKTLVNAYGDNTLFVIEDLKAVSTNDNLEHRSSNGRRELRSWSFYQLEQFLSYKATLTSSYVLKVPSEYTSQRCPKCGRIHKENRNHKTHEYVCDQCGYRSNDDRIGAMNLQMLGTLYVSGDMHPKIRKTT